MKRIMFILFTFTDTKSEARKYACRKRKIFPPNYRNNAKKVISQYKMPNDTISAAEEQLSIKLEIIKNLEKSLEHLKTTNDIELSESDLDEIQDLFSDSEETEDSEWEDENHVYSEQDGDHNQVVKNNQVVQS